MVKANLVQNFKFVKNVIRKKDSLPIYMIFEPTSICNARCSFCYNWETVTDSKNEMTLEQIEKFTKTMNNKLLTLALSGGEPFLRQDLVEVIKIFKKNCDMNHLAIPTNAIRSEHIYKSVNAILRVHDKSFVVLLSLDGVGEDHDKIRGVKGNFEKLMETYHKLATIENPRFDIGVTTTISSKNQDKYKEVHEHVKKNMPKVKSHNIAFMRGTPPDPSFKSPSIEFIRNNLDTLKEIALMNRGYTFDILGNFFKTTKARYYDIAYKTNKDGKRNWTCYAGQLTAYVDCYANVWPCEPYKPFANLKDFNYDFRKLWYSDEAEEIRDDIKEKKCTCDHGCFINMNTLFNPLEYFHLLNLYLTKKYA